MPIIGLTLATTRDFQSKSDAAFGTPEATTFVLGALDVFVASNIFDKNLTVMRGATGQPEGTRFHFNEVMLELARFGLKNWRNFKDSDGNDIPFATQKRIVNGKEYTVASDTSLAMIPFPVLMEIGMEVEKVNNVTKVEAKN